MALFLSFFFQAEDGIRDGHVTGVQTCALPICLDVTVVNSAVGIVRLKCKRSAAQFYCTLTILRLCKLHDNFSIHGKCDLLSFHSQMVCEPLIVFVGCLVHDIFHSVETSGFDWVGMCGIDLGFITVCRPSPLLKLCMKENSGIGFGVGVHFSLKLKICKVGIGYRPVIKKMCTWPVYNNLAIFDGKRFRVFIHGPVVKCFSVPE